MATDKRISGLEGAVQRLAEVVDELSARLKEYEQRPQ
jgi:hypothetical protein